MNTLRSDTRSIFIYIILYHIRYNFGQFVKYITNCLFVYIIKYTEFYIDTSIIKEIERKNKNNIKLELETNSKENFIFSTINNYNYYIDANYKKDNEDYIM